MTNCPEIFCVNIPGRGLHAEIRARSFARTSLNTIVEVMFVSIALICGSGYRSSVAASILRADGYETMINIIGGMAAWIHEDPPVSTIAQGRTQS